MRNVKIKGGRGGCDGRYSTLPPGVLDKLCARDRPKEIMVALRGFAPPSLATEANGFMGRGFSGGDKGKL